MKNQAQIIQQHGKTFYWASFFLEKTVRSRLFSIYAFCRKVDDIVDTNKKKSTNNFNKNLEEFTNLEKRFRPSKEIITQFILGQQSDLSHTQPKTIDELIIYCYRVAGIVGLMVCDALEVKDIKLRHYAIDLGIAMQLTNICRDIKEDANMERVYLPESMVGKIKPKGVKIPSKDVLKKIETCQKKLLDLADDYYASAEYAIPFLPGKTSLAIRVAANIYQAIGKKIINNNISYIEDRVFVNNYEKLKITFFKIFSKGKSSNKLKTHNIKLHNAIKDLPGANKN
ncbi:phytoene/squalene synthase family protein [Nitrosomonadales bacterium]|nr:phytoene/squalene synthase family protein [Nitrosomonadales bacterium]|tara:strand:+ start:2351 stop:3202 length:852 start_codon:yes stop_codon:yes gene_type:complete